MYRGGSRILASLRAIRDDLDLLERDEPVADHRVDLRQDLPQPVLLVDDLDEDREVGGEGQDPGRVEVVLRTESLDPADDGRAREPALSQQMDDRLVERLALPRVGLADIDPGEEARPFDLHPRTLPSARPANT